MKGAEDTMSAFILKKFQRIRRGGTPKVLDLFSGCGGLSLGFHRAGFDIWGGIEQDPEAAASHAVNFHGEDKPSSRKDMTKFARDILEVQPEELTASQGGYDPSMAVDILVGGPPCQSYARIGRAKLREVFNHPQAYSIDPRKDLYLRYLEYVKALRPLAILMENVPDALNCGGHNVAEETAEVLDELGYVCRYTLLNAVHYGVPQTRERMFLLAFHGSLGVEPIFPKPTHYWELPSGYKLVHHTALRPLQLNGRNRYVPAPEADPKHLSPAITTEEALKDLPPIMGHLSGAIGRGPRKLDEGLPYKNSNKPSPYASDMRNWPGFLAGKLLTGHVIRSLPRDYKLFRRMKHGDQYPEAHALAVRLFESYVERCRGTKRQITPDSERWHEVRARFVPPYDPFKFPNKWRKMAFDEPARTVMAHLGKDSYSHIHPDSRQARTISVREAARLQSFPDGFFLAGAMNAAFRQIGNAVPPLLAWRIAEQIRQSLSM